MISINKTGWKIIQELSKDNKTPTELANRLKVSLPSIHVQLKILEENKLIKKNGEVKGKTRPYAEYCLEEFVYFVKALSNDVDRRFLVIDDNIKLHLRIWSIPQKEYQYYVERFWWEIQDYLGDIDSIVVFGSVANGKAREGSDIDILMLVNKNLKKYEKMFKVKMIGKRGMRKMIMAQVFETEDFKKSFEKGSDFAAEVIKNHIVIYDTENFSNIVKCNQKFSVCPISKNSKKKIVHKGNKFLGIKNKNES